MKRIAGIAITLIVLTLFIMPLIPESTQAMTGSGTAGDPYMIYDVNDLQAMNDTLPDVPEYSRPWDDEFDQAAQYGTWTTYPIEGYDTELFWNKVDEEVSDGDDTYIQAESDGAYVLLAFEGTPLSLPSDAENIWVHIHVRVRNTASGQSQIQGMVRYAGTDYLVGPTRTIYSTSYTEYRLTVESPPWYGGLVEWSRADVYILAGGTGIIVHDATPNVRITQLWIAVSYTTPVYYELANDIDASVTATWNEDPGAPGTYLGFQPIGYFVEDDDWNWTGRYFSGGLDGNGHTITGLYINRTDAYNPIDNYLGLFGLTDGATIRDLTLADVDITGDDAYSRVGALGGSLEDTYVEGCHSTGAVTGGARTGGLAGEAYNAEMIRCSSSCAVSGSDEAGGLVGTLFGTIRIDRCAALGTVATSGLYITYAGGLIGRIFANTTIEITRCYATGSVSASSTTTQGAWYAYAGGLVAFVNSNETIISDSYAMGDTAASNLGAGGRAGGLIGATAEQGSVYSNCYATGQSTADETGGLIAYRHPYSGTIPLQDCFWDIDASGQATSDGGTGLTTAQMKDIAPFAVSGWDIDYTDAVWLNDGYPFLSWQVGNSPTWLMSSTMFLDINQVVHFQPNAIIEGTTLPNRAQGGGVYPDGVFSWGTNPDGIDIRLEGLLRPEDVYRFEPMMPSGRDIIEPEPVHVVGGIDLARLANNPLRPLVQVLSSTGQLTEQVTWWLLAIFIVIAAMVATQLLGQHIVFTSLVGFGLTCLFYAMGIWGIWVPILLDFGLVGSIVYERMPTL